MTPVTTHPELDVGGLTCLANLAAHLGVQAQVHQYLPLCRGFERPANLFSLIHLARLLGLEAVPLEGRYVDLAGCSFPLIVPLRGERPRFVVVTAVEDEAVRVLDPVQGPVPMPVTEFRQQWEQEGQGDAVAIQAGPGFAVLERRLRQARDPLHRLHWALGLRPPWPRKLGYTALALILLGGLLLGRAGALPLALAIALLAALWSWCFGAGCAACHGAARLAGGLPLAPLGTAGYAILLACALVQPVWLPLPLAAAVGVHLALLFALARARLACPACFVTAAAALSAALLVGPAAATALTLAAIPLAALATTAALHWGRRQWRLVALSQALSLAEHAWPADEPSDQVRILVYKRDDCAHCLLYEAMIRPALEQEFGDLLHFEERLARREKIDVPLMILQARQRVLALDLRGDGAHARARAAVLAALTAPPTGAERGLIVFGTHQETM